MKIFIFFILILTNSSLCFAQQIKLISVNSDSYPHISTIVELPKNYKTEKIQLFELNKKIAYQIYPVKKVKADYLFYLIDNSSFSIKEQAVLFEALSNSLLNLTKDQIFINIGLGVNTGTNNCLFALSYNFVPISKNFIAYAESMCKNLKNHSKPDCILKETIEFLHLKQRDTKPINIILITNKLKNYKDADPLFDLAEKQAAIQLKIISGVSDTINRQAANFFNVSETTNLKGWEQTIKRASANADLTNISSNMQYRIEFLLNNQKDPQKIKLQYKDEIIVFSVKQKHKYLFTKKYIYPAVIIILIIYLILLYKKMYSYKKKVHDLKETVSLLFDKKMKILSKQTEDPVLEIKLENSFTNYHLKKLNTSIGRSKDCDITIKDMTISTLHATITNEGGEFFIQDNESTNGVFVNDIKIKKKIIRSGDIIRMGKAILSLHY